MTTAPDERAGAHHHQADENLQNDACNGGGAFDPANPRTDGEKILPQLVRAIILRHTGYERERDIKKYLYYNVACVTMLQGHRLCTLNLIL